MDAGTALQQIFNGTTTASYKYNDSGIRTEKTVNGTTTKFNLVGSNITWQKTGTNNPIYFVYDSGGKLWAMKYTDGNTYFYVRNAQGDIIKIVNSSGTVVVEYTYDAWGNLMSTTGSMASTLGQDNPFRYRGYYYDDETGLYYLNQRYYNPQWGRFINADSLIGVAGKLLSHNLFAYCNNNPVMMSDPSGCLPMAYGSNPTPAQRKEGERYYKKHRARHLTRRLKKEQQESLLNAADKAGWDNVEMTKYGFSILNKNTRAATVFIGEKQYGQYAYDWKETSSRIGLVGYIGAGAFEGAAVIIPKVEPIGVFASTACGVGGGIVGAATVFYQDAINSHLNKTDLDYFNNSSAGVYFEARISGKFVSFNYFE